MNVLTFKRGMVVLSVCLACFGCFRNASLSTVKGEPYPQSVQDEFMKGCQKGKDANFCACVFVKVQSTYSLAEFYGIESKIKAGTPPQEFMEFTSKASAECLEDK